LKIFYYYFFKAFLKLKKTDEALVYLEEFLDNNSKFDSNTFFLFKDYFKNKFVDQIAKSKYQNGLEERLESNFKSNFIQKNKLN
jgi:hypothetical protein